MADRNRTGRGFANGATDEDGSQIYMKRNGSGRNAALAAGYAEDEMLDEEGMDEEEEEEEYEEIVADEGRELLAHLIVNEMAKENNPQVAARIEEQVRQTSGSTRIRRIVFTPNASSHGLGSRTSTDVIQQEQIVDALARIGDALEADRELNSLIVRVPPEATWETFQKVAKVLFADGVSWGRIVALFFFACKMVRRSLDSIPMISHILDWASRIIKLYLAQWIVRRGGWRGVLEWFGPSWSQIGMTFGAVLCAYCVAWRMKYA